MQLKANIRAKLNISKVILEKTSHLNFLQKDSKPHMGWRKKNNK